MYRLFLAIVDTRAGVALDCHDNLVVVCNNRKSATFFSNSHIVIRIGLGIDRRGDRIRTGIFALFTRKLDAREFVFNAIDRNKTFDCICQFGVRFAELLRYVISSQSNILRIDLKRTRLDSQLVVGVQAFVESSINLVCTNFFAFGTSDFHTLKAFTFDKTIHSVFKLRIIVAISFLCAAKSYSSSPRSNRKLSGIHRHLVVRVRCRLDANRDFILAHWFETAGKALGTDNIHIIEFVTLNKTFDLIGKQRRCIAINLALVIGSHSDFSGLNIKYSIYSFNDVIFRFLFFKINGNRIAILRNIFTFCSRQ